MAKKKTKLEIGKFYYIFGGKPHPAQIYEIDKKYKTYKSIKTGTTKRSDMTPIKPIQNGYEKSFVHKRPVEGVRSDYGDRELVGLAFDPSDESTINTIKQRKPKRTKKAKLRYKEKMPPSD